MSIVGEVEPDHREGAKRNLAEQVMIDFRRPVGVDALGDPWRTAKEK